jgi:hypothetical protein
VIVWSEVAEQDDGLAYDRDYQGDDHGNSWMHFAAPIFCLIRRM